MFSNYRQLAAVAITVLVALIAILMNNRNKEQKMSVCKVENGQKRKHVYPDGKNQCSVCHRITIHGKKFREAQRSK